MSRPLVTLLAALCVAAATGASAADAPQKPAAQQRPQPAAPAAQDPQRRQQPVALPDADQVQPGEKLPPAVAAVIDYQRVLREAKAAKSISDQLEARRKLYQDQIAKEEQKPQDADKELAKQRGVLSAEALGAKREDLQKRAAELQKLVNDKRRQLGSVSSAALNDVRNAMLQVVGDLSGEHGFNLVLPSNTVLMFAPKIDMTDEVIKRLDEALPSVKIPTRSRRTTPRHRRRRSSPDAGRRGAPPSMSHRCRLTGERSVPPAGFGRRPPTARPLDGDRHGLRLNAVRDDGQRAGAGLDPAGGRHQEACRRCRLRLEAPRADARDPGVEDVVRLVVGDPHQREVGVRLLVVTVGLPDVMPASCCRRPCSCGPARGSSARS